MSGKSRRRGRHLSRSQRKKLGRDVSSPAATTPTTSTPAAVAGPTPSPRAEAPVPAAKPVAKAVAPSTDVSGELRRIGLVGGLIVAILVAAYFVLPLILD